MNDFYVYEYIRLDTNEPFYVGKGHSLTTKRIFLCVRDAMNEYGIKGNSNIGNCCKGWKIVNGKKKPVKSVGKYKGQPLKWKYVKWNHNKKFRISK